MTGHVQDDLGLYALGLVDERERAIIDAHLGTCAECRAALGAHERTVWQLADAAATEAPRRLRDAIVTRHRAPARPRRWQLAFAAAALVAIAALATLAGARDEVAREQRLRDEYARALAAIAQGGRVFPMQARPDVAGSGAVVVSKDGDPYLVMTMPAPPAGKAYEAWIIRGGVPARAGIAPAQAGTVSLRLEVRARPGDVAAITLEDAAGVDRPTSEPLMVAAVGGL
jgi:hypothetical protein